MGDAVSMMLSVVIESITLSVPPAESMMLSACAESTILSAPPAESMILSAQEHACALTLRACLQAGGAESIILSASGAESLMLLAPVESIILITDLNMFNSLSAMDGVDRPLKN